MVVAFDLDGVLYDSEKLKEKLGEEFRGFKDSYPDSKDDGVYRFRKHCEKMSVSPEKYLETVRHVSPECIYDDIKFLEGLEEEKTIVTRGDPEMQEAKIENSGVLEYFDSYIIVEELSKDIYNVNVLVDDSESEIERFSGKTYHFQRDKNNLKQIVKEINRDLGR